MVVSVGGRVGAAALQRGGGAAQIRGGAVVAVRGGEAVAGSRRGAGEWRPDAVAVLLSLLAALGSETVHGDKRRNR